MIAHKHGPVLLVATCLVLCSDIVRSNDACNEQAAGTTSAAHGAWIAPTGSSPVNRPITPDDSNIRCYDQVNRMFRTFNGTCNHPRNLGASFMPADNLLPPAYDDGVSSPRQRGVDGLPLPSARNVSLRVHPSGGESASLPYMVMQWGQWIAHDMANVAGRFRRPGCCGVNGGCPLAGSDKDCFPIELPAGENHFPGVCMHFGRTAAADVLSSVPARARQHKNEATSFLDGSQIYGPTDEVAAAIREPGGYLLLTKNDSFLPESTAACNRRSNTSDYCFLAGDFRVNQHAYLSALHTIWVREHNRIARRLRAIKPTAQNEEIFQLSRKIIIAIQQVITYNVYLPIILGRDAYHWSLTSTSGRSVYNPDLNPSILIAFSSAAFRYGHTNIPSFFSIGQRQVQLRYLFNRTADVLDHFDNVVAGLGGGISEQKIQSSDRNFVEEVSNFMFWNIKTGNSFDLVAFDIQRGRDHGLAPYVKWRSYCGLRPLTGFNDTEALGPFVNELGQVYRSVKDIDLFTGMMYEPVDTGLVGPTARCIMRIQFYRTKYGDRFYFDNSEPSTAFSDVQLAALRNVTLSQVLCHNANIQGLPQDVFRLLSSSNPWTPCTTLRLQDFNLALFA